MRPRNETDAPSAMAKRAANELTEPRPLGASHIVSEQRMKRSIVVKAALLTALVLVAPSLGACSEKKDAAVAAQPGAPAETPWARPPMVDAARREGGEAVVKGAAAPGARVVLRGADGAAVAVSADADGRFELRAPLTPGDVRLRPEVQIGEDAAPSPETLVLLQGGAGPIVLIAAGEPTSRLDGRGRLDAVDSDGAVLIVSGRSTGSPPEVTIDGRPVPVLGRADGGWRATAPDAGAASLVVDGERFDYPGVGSQSDFQSQRAGDGWRLTWPTGPSGRQTTWLPDRAG